MKVKNRNFTGFAMCILIFLGMTKIDVPPSVLKAFSEKFPTAKKIKWEKEGDIYEADFKITKKEMSAEFSATGSWLSTETEIKISQLPKTVLQAIKTKYPGYKTEEPEQIELSNGTIQFEVEIEKGKEELEVIFDSEGNLISEESENE